MEKIKPLIRCVDFWPGQIPPEKLKIYKQLITENQITKPHVIYSQRTGSTSVEYLAIAPHEWILSEMKRRISEGAN